jgi:hypothetical protein
VHNDVFSSGKTPIVVGIVVMHQAVQTTIGFLAGSSEPSSLLEF